ncbi:MAG: histidine phosphatase family protein, partial [Nakamurella sp.]
DNRYAGATDIELTAAGLAQAEQLAVWAATTTVSRVICSDLSRAVRTASPSATVLGLPLEIEPRLREVDFGRGEGMTTAEMRAAFPDALDAFVAAPATSPLPGGEPGAHAVARAGAALVDLCAVPDDELLVVAHNTLGRLLLCALLGIPLDRYRNIFPRLDNGAVTTLELPGAVTDVARLVAGVRLLRFNSPAAALAAPPTAGAR